MFTKKTRLSQYVNEVHRALAIDDVLAVLLANVATEETPNELAWRELIGGDVGIDERNGHQNGGGVETDVDPVGAITPPGFASKHDGSVVVPNRQEGPRFA